MQLSVFEQAFDKVPQFSPFDVAFAAGQSSLHSFGVHESSMQGLGHALEVRKHVVTDRQLLFERLFIQYKRMGLAKEKLDILHSLTDENTFTIITAHQPILFGGPMYIVYKALSVIYLCRELAKIYPECKFVPVFILGAEDHDFEEINHISVFGKNVSWETEASGAVGALSTQSLQAATQRLAELLGDSEMAKALFSQVQSAYSNYFNFGDATQELLQNWFGPLGMLVANMNDDALKRRFIPYMEREIFEQISQPLVAATQTALSELGFKQQAFARPINLFYLQPGLRARIEREGDKFVIIGTEISFSEAEMRLELYTHPERFSPNVVMRPLYQEVIFPNLAYVGGGGEIAYWLERKSQFEAFGVPFPVLVRRMSALWLSQADKTKWESKKLSISDLFVENHILQRAYLATQESESIDIELEKQTIQKLYEQLASKAKAIDPTLEKSILAEATRQIQALEQTGAKLIKALKAKHETGLQQVLNTQQRLFPNGSLQERVESPLSVMAKFGPEWLEAMLPLANPFQLSFKVITPE